jgi:hypothetical protein
MPLQSKLLRMAPTVHKKTKKKKNKNSNEIKTRIARTYERDHTLAEANGSESCISFGQYRRLAIWTMFSDKVTHAAIFVSL